MNSRLQSRKHFSLNQLIRTRYFFYFLVTACALMVWTLTRQGGSTGTKGSITNAILYNNKLRGWNEHKTNQKNGFWFGPDVPAFVS